MARDGVLRSWTLLAGAAAALAMASATAKDGQLAEAGECELEAGLSHERSDDRSAAHEQALALSCGLDGDNELDLSLQRQRDGDGATRQLGLEVRTVLLAGGSATGARPWQWALAYGLAFETAPGSGWREARRFVALQGGVAPAEGWWLEAMLGTERDLAAGRDRTPWALTVEVEQDDAIAWQLQLSGTDRARPVGGLEATFAIVPERLDLKLGLEAPLGRGRERALAAGLVVPF